MRPPRLVIVESAICTTPLPLPPTRPLLLALSVTFSGAVVLSIVEPEMMMSRCALKLRLTAAGGAALIFAPDMMMSPPSLFVPAAAVVRLTLVPALSTATMVPVKMNAASLVVVNAGPAEMCCWVPASPTCRSLGSSSHRPARPRGAAALTAAGRASSQPPEVSMKPPSPPNGPPRAEKSPKARVARSLQTMMRPPSPCTVASASSRAPAPM